MSNFTKGLLGGAISGALIALVFTYGVLNFSGVLSSPQNSKDSLVNSGKNIAEAPFTDQEKILAKTQEDLVVRAVEKASPAVISVLITKDVPVLEKYYEEYYTDPFDDIFNDPFFNFKIPQYRQKGTEKKRVGGGSGFLVSEDGYIVTNKHVVEDEKAEYTVILDNTDKKYDAKVVARDPLNDIAVLKIEEKNLPFLEFADSDKIKAGRTVIAIGNPLLEFNNSVSVGVVSGLSRSIVASDGFMRNVEQLEGVIQTDAAINPGNSGGPLLDLDGNVIGVNVAIADAENIGFALPSNLVKNVVESVKKNGKIVRPYLGVRYVQINEELKKQNKLTVDYGVLVTRGETMKDLAVSPGSPADKAGIVENDIILEADGKKLDKNVSLARIVAQKNAGDKIALKILHKGEEKIVEITLDKIPE